MYGRKLTDTSGTRKREYLKDKINKFESNSKPQNIRDMHRAINAFKNG
jgi:predicted GTPase